MGKKYLETKKNSLESSILGVWKTAVEEGAGRMDGRTAEYRNHRAKLEAARQRRESKKVNKEEAELDEGKIVFDDHDADDRDFVKLIKKHGLKAKSDGDDTTVTGSPDKIEKVLQTMYGNDWKDMYTRKGQNFENFDGINETAVNPKDREELDKAPSDTAKKIKKAKEPEPNQMAEAQSGDKEAYKKFFDAALKKFKVDSPADFKSDEEKKKFYDYIDKNWEGDNEKAEGAMSQVREFKIQSLKAALAKVWGMEEGKNPFAEGGMKRGKDLKTFKPKPKKEEDDKEVVKNGKTETGKKPAVIDLKPKIKDS